MEGAWAIGCEDGNADTGLLWGGVITCCETTASPFMMVNTGPVTGCEAVAMGPVTGVTTGIGWLLAGMDTEGTTDTGLGLGLGSNEGIELLTSPGSGGKVTTCCCTPANEEAEGDTLGRATGLEKDTGWLLVGDKAGLFGNEPGGAELGLFTGELAIVAGWPLVGDKAGLLANSPVGTVEGDEGSGTCEARDRVVEGERGTERLVMEPTVDIVGGYL